MKEAIPIVSIGLPVYNGEKYLEAAIKSILQQTFHNFELIISDNASTDKTENICKTYAERDKRIRYYRNDTNLGAAENFNRVFRHSRGKYFKWAAHDDIIARDFLAKCISPLQQDDSLVLCYGKSKLINESGEITECHDISMPNIGSDDPYERFGDLVLIDHWCFAIFGVIRKEVLANTPLIGKFVASDRVLLAELGLRGRLQEVPEFLFFSRQHEEQSIRAIYYNFRTAWFDPEKSGKVIFPNWRLMAEYLKCIGRVPLQRSDRTRCYLKMIRWLGVNVHWARMMADILLAIRPGSVDFVRKAENWYYHHRNQRLKRQRELRSV